MDNHKFNAVLSTGEEAVMATEAHHSQSTAEGYARLLCPSDTRLIDTDYRYTEVKERRDGEDVERETDRQTERSRACWETLSGCKWNDMSTNMLRDQ